MASKPTKDIRKIIEKSNIQEEHKKIINEYFGRIDKFKFEKDAGFVITVPFGEEDDFLCNTVFNFKTGHKHFEKHYEIIDKKHIGLTAISSVESKATIAYGKFETSGTSIPRSIFNVDLEKKINDLNDKYDKLLENQEDTNKKLDKIKEIIFDLTSEQDFDEKIQFLPISIYIDTNDNSEIFNVYQSVIDLIKAINFESSIELNAIKGSWFKKIIAKSKTVMSDKEVTDRLKELEYALEVKILKDQSEVDKNQSEALTNVLKSVENIDNAAIKIGSLLVVKQKSNTGEALVQVRTLSILELHILNKRPDLLLKPKEILISLAEMIGENEDDKKSLN